MTRWVNACGSIGTILIATAMYFADASAQAMTVLLLLFALAVFMRECTQWAIIYLGLVVNLLFLWMALWLMDGQISYLSDNSFTPYYKKALLLETIFWATFAGLFGGRIRATEHTATGGVRIGMRLPAYLQFLTAIALLLLEIVLSSGAYFKPYSEVSDTGTIAYELGCLFVALAIVSRSNHPDGIRTFALEIIGIGLALFIALGSGKRLPFAYVVIAYMLLCLRHYGKIRTALLFLALAMLSFGFGVIRDFMSSDGIDSAMFMTGFGHTNQGGVLHASAVYLRIADEGLSSVFDRSISFLSNFFGALVLPMSLLPEQAQVNVHAMRHYDVQGNGGFVGSYAYFFVGWVGPVLLASALSNLRSGRGRWIELIGMIVLLTSPRWTLYNIGPVLRLISMTLITLALLQLVFDLVLISQRRHHGSYISPSKQETRT